MPPPAPPVPLKDHCSGIHDNILYVYSPDALQSIPLRSDAQWSQEPMGVSVTGATCVVGGIDGDNSKTALYVVGGSTNSSSIQYPGLQRFNFQDKKWDSISPIVSVTQNRRSHGTAYLNATSSILVYAGSQDGDATPSTQTFLISTMPPYGVSAFESKGAPPAVNPMTMPWSDNLAVMVGGGPSNDQVFTFGPDQGWQNVGVTLTSPIPDHATAQCGLLSLSDGSKVLETFDMSQSPNAVSRTVLLGPGGVPASPGQSIGTREVDQPAFQQQKRDLTLGDLPKYNGSLAPAATRNGFSLSQGPDNLVVIAGGSSQDPLCIFNQSENSWLNATRLLQGKANSISTGGTGPNPGASSIPTPSSSPSPTAPASTGPSKNRVLTILGAVLGGIFGLAALCVIALLLLRWMKGRKERRGQRHSLDYPIEKKAVPRLSFEDAGIQPLSTAAQPMGRGPVPSSASAAMFNTQYSSQRPTPSRPLKPETPNIGVARTETSNPNPFNSRPLIPSQPRDEPRPDTNTSAANTSAADASSGDVDPSLNGNNRRTDEGWAKYFQGDNATLADGRSTYVSQGSESDYRGSYFNDRESQSRDRGRSPGTGMLRDSRGNVLPHMTVAIGSPNIEHPSADGRGTGLAVAEGTAGKISNVGADSSSATTSDDEAETDHVNNEVDYDRIGDEYSSGIPSSIPDGHAWVPGSGAGHGMRAPSSNYTNSIYPPTSFGGLRDTNIPPFPMPSSRPLTRWPDEELPRGQTSQQNGPPSRPRRPSQQTRDYFGPNPGRGTGNSDDMSWLNLGHHP
ncbi:MAG: hypothetical protein Q9160_000884 [Pyrenula sp. 1 TL-2023]